MKNTDYLLIIYCLLTIALFACEPKPLELKIGMTKPKIIITSVFNNENQLGVLVTKSFSALADLRQDPLDLFYGARIENAKVKIRNNGKVYSLADLSPLFVSDGIAFLPYSDYTITVEDTVSGESVMAVTIMLPKVALDTLTIKVSRKTKDTSFHLHISLDEAGHAKKYYIVTFKLSQQQTAERVKKSLIKKSLYEQIELFDNSKAFAGKVVYEKDFNQAITAFGSRDSMIIDVSEVSEAYYHYLSIYKKTGSMINQLTGEPVNFPSNVQGGAGFFFLANPVYTRFDLSRQ